MTVVIDGQSFCLGEAVFGTGRQFCELTGRVNAPLLPFFPFVFRCFSTKNIMPTYSFCMKQPCFLLALIVKLNRMQYDSDFGGSLPRFGGPRRIGL